MTDKQELKNSKELSNSSFEETNVSSTQDIIQKIYFDPVGGVEKGSKETYLIIDNGQ